MASGGVRKWSKPGFDHFLAVGRVKTAKTVVLAVLKVNPHLEFYLGEFSNSYSFIKGGVGLLHIFIHLLVREGGGRLGLKVKLHVT